METNDDNDFFSTDAVADAFADAIGGIRPEEDVRSTPDDDATAPEDEESLAGDDEDQEEDNTPAPAHNPEGPGNLKAALKEAREEAKVFKAQYAATNARLAAIESERAQQQAAIQQQQQRNQIQQAVEELHPDDVPAYLEQVARHQREQVQREASERANWERLSQSAAAARRSLPDFDNQLTKLTGVFGEKLVNLWAMGQEHPALAVYDAAKGFYTQSDIEAAREEGRQAALEALPARTRKPASAPRLANIPQAGRTQDSTPTERLTKRLEKGGDVSGVVEGLFTQALQG